VRLFRLTTPASFSLALAAASVLAAQTPSAADLGKAVLSARLDPTACFRVRDLEISQEDARFYLTDGYIIFGKPVNGAPVSAVFSAEIEGGDAEVLLLPPNRSERKALAGYTGSPNLDEHFTNAIFLFTEVEARGLAEKIRAKGEAKNSPEVGALLADQWSSIVANISGSYESRMVLDLLAGKKTGGAQHGFFKAILKGKKLGNFDFGYDSRAWEQLNVGQLNPRDGATWFDTWTSFASQSHRSAQPPTPEEEILSYRIEATLDSAFILHCITHIRFRATDDSRNAIPFDMSAQMRPTAATLDGVAAEVYERDSVRNNLVQNSGNELLLVIPPRPLEPGSEHEVEIRHEGKVVLDAGHQVYFVSSRGSWYPDRGAQFATYDVTYRYPKNLDLVSAGEVGEDNVTDEAHLTRRVTDSRIRWLGFNLGVYERKELERDGIRIEVCANREVEDALRYRPAAEPPPADPPLGNGTRRRRQVIDPGVVEPPPAPATAVNPANQLTQVADDVAAAVEFYRARFGAPPVNRIEVSPVPGRFGQGFAGMIYLSTLSYLPVTARPLSLMPPWQQVFYGQFLRAHEVAHQWWGNIVTTGPYRDEWLMEALANYSALLFLESRGGPKLIDSILDQYRRMLLTKGPDGETAESEGPVVQGRRLETSNNPSAWNAVAYGKGTWILHMLRRRMGDEQFTKMLAELRRRYEWKTIDTDQFRLLCAEFLPPQSPDPKLENFFDQWVYGTGIPTLKLTSSVKGKAGAWKLTGTIAQSDVPDDFSVTIPVEIQTGRGKVVREIQTGADPVTFSVPVAAANAKAALDPASSVLRR
jgi:Peptidase family M1 domain